MEVTKFASLHDFQQYALKWLDGPTYEYLQGQPRPAHHFTDFNLLRLRLRAMPNMK
jgi:hypothetical protein